MLIDVRSSKDRNVVLGRIEMPEDELPKPNEFAGRGHIHWVRIPGVGISGRAAILELTGKTADDWFLLAAPQYLDEVRKVRGWQEPGDHAAVA